MNPKAPPITFYRLIRFYDGKEQIRLVTCGGCAAVVAEDNQQHHELWHREMTDDLITCSAAAAKTAENRIKGTA